MGGSYGAALMPLDLAPAAVGPAGTSIYEGLQDFRQHPRHYGFHHKCLDLAECALISSSDFHPAISHQVHHNAFGTRWPQRIRCRG
jgi:hypothetical protein